MSCSKNLYELFGVSGPTYSTDQIWYLGYHQSQSNFPYTDAPQDVVADSTPVQFGIPTVSFEGGISIELVSGNFGGFAPIPDHPSGYQGVLIADTQDVSIIVQDYCNPTLSTTNPYLEFGTPTQPGFYFFLREVSDGGCIAFSQVYGLQIGIGAELPESHQIDVGCEIDNVSCYDASQHLDPDHPNFQGTAETACMYPPYNPDYWDQDPTCLDLTVAGTYIITYTVPAADLNLVFPVDPNCDECGTADLTITLTLTVGGSDVVAPPITVCN